MSRAFFSRGGVQNHWVPKPKLETRQHSQDAAIDIDLDDAPAPTKTKATLGETEMKKGLQLSRKVRTG